jgi:hypothetical protein
MRTVIADLFMVAGVAGIVFAAVLLGWPGAAFVVGLLFLILGFALDR